MKKPISQVPRLTNTRMRQARKLLVLAVSALLLCWSILGPVQAAAGGLDPSFGSGGKVTTDFGGTLAQAHSVATQGDGKTLLAGNILDNSFQSDFTVARYDASGNLDPTFGVGGAVKTNFSPQSDDVAFGMTVQPDGRIILAGSTEGLSTPGGRDFALARYNSDGGLDSSFGSGGKVTTDFFNSSDEAKAVAIQTDGKIMAAGIITRGAFFEFALARYNSDGSLDTSFGLGGKVTTVFDGLTAQLTAIAFQPDGKLVAAGTLKDDPHSFTVSFFGLARYNTNGSLDSAFGSGGKLMTAFSEGFNFANSVAIQPDSKIIVAGGTGSGESAEFADFALARYNSDGSLDASFGSGGHITTDFFGHFDIINAIVLQPDGRIVAAGSADVIPLVSDFALARYNHDGSLDAAFGSGGKVTTNFFDGISCGAFAVGLQSGGKIIAGGATGNDRGGSNFALARYLGESFDICIQDDGNGNIFQFNSTTGEYQFTNCAGSTSGGIGSVTRNGRVITLQHNASDRRVLARVDTSVNKATATIQLLSPRATFTITDRNTANNTCTCR